MGTAGVLLAYMVLACAVVSFLIPLPLLLAVAGFGPFLGLVLLGSDILRAGSFSPPWSVLPLVLGLGTLPLILAGGLLTLINERLLEIPITLVGFAWMLLGYAVLMVKRATIQPPAP